MTIYIVAIFTFSLFSYLEVFNPEIVKKYKVMLLILCFFYLVFHDGFRWETGSDWIPYYNYYENFTIKVESDKLFEPGYLLFMGLLHSISEDYSFYLVVHALVFYSLFFFAIVKISNYPFVSLLLFYMIIVPYMGMNRQFLAMSLFSVGLVYFLEGKRWLFLTFVIAAFFFHKTVVLALPALFMNRELSKKAILILLLIALIISLSGIVNILGTGVALAMSGDGSATSARLDLYTNLDNETSVVSTVFSLAKKTIWLLLLLFFKDKIDKDSKYNLLFNMYLFSVVIYIMFNNTVLQIVVSRGLLYYNLTEMFVVPYVLTIFKPNYGKLGLMLLLSIYCSINIFKGFSNYGENNDYFIPYKGLFINTDYVRQDKE